MSNAPKVLRVFLSSTAIDMTACREKVRDAVLQLEHLPLGMETFTALPTTPAKDCQAKAADADAVIVMVAYRFGYVPSVELGGDGEHSITWLEVLAAKAAGKPVFAFLIEPTAAWSQPKEVDRLNTEPKEKRAEILAAIDGLNDFKAYLQKHCTFDTFTNEDDLARRVGAAIASQASQVAPGSESAAGVASEVAVHLVTDYRSPDVRAALELYDDRIPESERFESPDIIRWLREDQEQGRLGLGRPRDHFLIAKFQQRVCGFTLVHYFPAVRLAFVAYMVAQRGIPIDSGSVSAMLLEKVERLFANEQYLADCVGFLFEVEDPRRATSEDERRERLSRIRLFCMLAETAGLQLRVLDFEYRQPQVQVPRLSDVAEEVPMLLMYAPRTARLTEGHFARSEVESFLTFIHRYLYPEGFSDVEAENQAYRAYLECLLCEQLARLPDRVAALSFAQFRRR